MYEDDDTLFTNILFAVIGVLGFLFLTLVLMIPILNVFIAKKIFGED